MIFEKADKGKLNFINLELSQMTDNNKSNDQICQTQNSIDTTPLKIRNVNRRGQYHQGSQNTGVNSLNMSLVLNEKPKDDMKKKNPIKVESNILKTDRPMTNDPMQFKRTLGIK